MTFTVVIALLLVQPPTSAKVPPPIPMPVPVLVSPEQGMLPTPPTPPPTHPSKVIVHHVFLRHFDADGNGKLDPSELKRRFVKGFSKADRNGDGFLDAQEILYDQHALGRTARRMEELDLDKAGNLVRKGSGSQDRIPVSEIARGVLQTVDRNGDGVIVGPEIGETIRMELIPRIKNGIQAGLNPPSVAPSPEIQPPVPSHDPSTVPSPGVKSPPPIPMPATVAPSVEAPSSSKTDGQPHQSGAGRAKKKAGKGGGDLPSAEDMLAHLDRNGDGVLDPNEAVDQLAKNFKMLDKDKSGTLSKEEIERGLRLARMFGIKPMKPPTEYAK
jgi:Ca2+-binding EF-hand superfamily protein